MSFASTYIVPVAGAMLFAVLGCSSYRYLREPSAELEQTRQDYVTNNPGNRFNDDIEAGRIRKGMSRLQVRVTWGDPDDVSPQVPGTELWSYQEDDPQRGTSIYSLRFDGELLRTVDIQHSNLTLSTEEKETKPAAELPRPTSGKKPGSFD